MILRLVLLVALATAPGAAWAQSFVGTASWYGARHHGRLTASGARFDATAATAACWCLPLGSRARVTNIRNGRSAVVTITDRGPTIRGRLIDVSLAVARRLDFVQRGLARVRIDRIEAKP